MIFFFFFFVNMGPWGKLTFQMTSPEVQYTADPLTRNMHIPGGGDSTKLFK